MGISLIAAVDLNGGIGYQNKMPWYIPEDFQWFKAKTMHRPVVMGRKTFESIGKPLSNRENIVLTRRGIYRPDVTVLHNIADVMAHTENDHEVMIIGGANTYKQFLPYATRLYLTEINAEFECDTFFPDVDVNIWKRFLHKDGQGYKGLDYTFNVYKKKV